jgi:hypothetical protein
MPNHMSEQEVQTAVREVIRRSLADPVFRVMALSNSHAAIAAVSSKALPPGEEYSFVENHGRQLKTVVLPDPASEPDRLGDADLEKVAGGCGVNSCEFTGTVPGS